MNGPPPVPDEATRAAQQLERCCQRLLASLRAVHRAGPEGVEDACGRHLKEAHALAERIEAAIDTLNRHRAGLEALSEGRRERLIRPARRARSLLLEAAGAYGELADDFGDVLGSIRSRLDGLRRGGRVLRTYQRANRGIDASS